ncbi:DinB superfamily protein [Rosistilla oblonga]|uniref:DinB superfamily protein n=2 Tax=Rosistilla TaxID=2795779 RepID=A0A518IPP7_9BACT|nr:MULTISPECIES: DinB family protein [Rosistilla]QDS86814.1 DinB superfamily protein [Rosistilla ulvae]QDV11133.1 DinB superfamily protein [Rosistilla oblonga]QDV55053.1 DinB superfamily protein [Rosistilla oblonga]
MSVELDIETVEKSRAVALGQIEFARQYTLELLDNTPQELWFQMPAGLPTHVAWQVGHLAYSQYGLLVFRQRGREPEDLELVPGTFRKKYGRGTTPDADPAGQPTPDELLQRLSTIHQRSIEVVTESSPQRLLEPIDMPYAVYPNKLGAILFCPLHEHIHAGQIGLLRRMLGLNPVR